MKLLLNDASCREAGPKNYKPIHMAAFNGCSKDTLALLLKQSASAIGQTLLHSKNDRKLNALAIPFLSEKKDEWMGRDDPPSGFLSAREMFHQMADALPGHFAKFGKAPLHPGSNHDDDDDDDDQHPVPPGISKLVKDCLTNVRKEARKLKKELGIHASRDFDETIDNMQDSMLGKRKR